jgi:hypothetical protein
MTRDMPGPSDEPGALPIVLECDARLLSKVRYTFDTLFLAAGIPVTFERAAPAEGPWLHYGPRPLAASAPGRCVTIRHCPRAWALFDGDEDVDEVAVMDGLHVVLPPSGDDATAAPFDIRFDLIANAFCFLSSWSERVARHGDSRRLHAQSVFARLGIPQDIADRYLQRLVADVRKVRSAEPASPAWPDGKSFALVLSHDVDFLPHGFIDNVVQGGKSVLRHLVRQRDPGDAARAALGWLRAMTHGRDPYGCVPELIAREQQLGLRSSFQVAVARRHPHDVNYRIEDDRTRSYLQAIRDAGFDLCLHGSYRSTERRQWYVEEVERLARCLGRPAGSRQHFLSFDFDMLFSAQEDAGIQYDMSMGYPDRPGPRAGFSYPYFPYDLAADRPYRVLEISLFLMDVTLRSYLGLRPGPARRAIDDCIGDLRRKGGCASVVWHPIVFGGARDPGYDELFFDMARDVADSGGLATDGRTVNDHWRQRARGYASFSGM